MKRKILLAAAFVLCGLAVNSFAAEKNEPEIKLTSTPQKESAAPSTKPYTPPSTYGDYQERRVDMTQKSGPGKTYGPGEGAPCTQK